MTRLVFCVECLEPLSFDAVGCLCPDCEEDDLRELADYIEHLEGDDE